MNKYIKHLLLLSFAISFFAFGWMSRASYSSVHTTKTYLDTIKRKKQLNVVLLNAPSAYYIGTDGPQGFEYDLLNAYAQHLGVDLNITTANTIKEAIELSKNPNIHITSAALAKTKEREKTFNFGPSYFEVQEQVICNRGMLGKNNFPRDIESLASLRISVGDDTSYSETIHSLQSQGYDINVTFTSEYSTEELLAQVATNEIDCTIADSNIYALNLRYYPEIVSAFTISEREQLAWVLAPDSKELAADMYAWFNGFNQDGSMAQLKDHYYSDMQFFDYYDTTVFYKRIEVRLPKYQHLFVEAGEKHSLPWTLLAAISYQESYWNPNSISFTGVKGLMMLTLQTAKILEIENRTDPKQSILGGTRHLKKMLELLPKEVEGENRLKFALAAYNIGLGHVTDAQALAKRLGLNENIWTDLKRALPLLSKKKYNQTLKYGYARGEEPVKYVDSIYVLKDILENHIEDKKIENNSTLEKIH